MSSGAGGLVLTDRRTASSLERWLRDVRRRLDPALDRMVGPGGAAVPRRWHAALEETRMYAARRGKRLRPALVLAGYRVCAKHPDPPDTVWQFAAAVEVVHTFMLIHDDVADGAPTRRGGRSLHRALAEGKHGADLAVVMGDYLFAVAIDEMLGSDLPTAAAAAKSYLRWCRGAAMGQYLDLDLVHTPLSELTCLQALRVARLKTAGPTCVGPLVAGGTLAGAPPGVIETLARIGGHVGLAFQLRDDLLALYGDPARVGKPGGSDLEQGTRTFPLIAAYVRSPTHTRRELEELWSCGVGGQDALERARDLVDRHGGRAAAERAIRRATGAARRAMADLPGAAGSDPVLSGLIRRLSDRDS